MKEILMSEGFIGVIIGGFMTFWAEWCIKKYEVKQELSHSASLLLYDLKSIQKYIEGAKRLSYPTTNIRYSGEWQIMISKCTFLSDREIALLYEIYDLVHDYNYEYEKGRQDRYSKTGVTFPIAHELLPPIILQNTGMTALYQKLERFSHKNKKEVWLF